MASVLSIDLWTIWNNFLSFLPTYLRLALWLSMEVELLDLQLLAVKLVTCPAWRPTEVANHTSKGHKRKSRNEEYLEMGHPETSAATALFVLLVQNPTISRYYDWWPNGWWLHNVTNGNHVTLTRVLWKPPAGLKMDLETAKVLLEATHLRFAARQKSSTSLAVQKIGSSQQLQCATHPEGVACVATSSWVLF